MYEQPQHKAKSTNRYAIENLCWHYIRALPSLLFRFLNRLSILSLNMKLTMQLRDHNKFFTHFKKSRIKTHRLNSDVITLYPQIAPLTWERLIGKGTATSGSHILGTGKATLALTMYERTGLQMQEAAWSNSTLPSFHSTFSVCRFSLISFFHGKIFHTLCRNIAHLLNNHC